MRKETVVTTIPKCRTINTDDKTKTVEVTHELVTTTQARPLTNRELEIVIDNLIKEIKTWLRKQSDNQPPHPEDAELYAKLTNIQKNLQEDPP